MKFADIFILATRMFKARTMRTILTVLGMSVGIGAIIFLVSLGYGLQRTILEKITTPDSLLTLDVSQEKNSQTKLTKESVEKIKQIPEVSEVSPSTSLNAKVNFSDLTAEIETSVIDTAFLRLAGAKVSMGNAINDKEVNGIIITPQAAQVFGKSPEEMIGKEVTLTLAKIADETQNGEKAGGVQGETYAPEGSFRIIGVIESESSIIYINSEALKNFDLGDYSLAKVKCSSDTLMNLVSGKIKEQGFFVSSISEMVDQTNKIFRAIKIVLMLFGIIALVVSAIGMFNTMTITLLERTEEIGIMKSIGASNAIISMIFLLEAAIMGILGGVLGVIIGWLEGRMFNLIVNLIATHFGGQKVDLFYSPWWFILLVVVFSTVVGFATGINPARNASKIDPLEALRYK